MAYMTKEKAKEIRTALKKAFPEVKLSVRVRHHMSLDVAIVKSPYFEDGATHTPRRNEISPEGKALIEGIDKIIREVGNYYNNSDLMTDYFDSAFYYSIEVGKWDKPHVKA